MIPVSAAEKILAEKTFFVSTFLDKYNYEDEFEYLISAGIALNVQAIHNG